MTEQQFKEITEWQKETFPNSTARSKLQHLKEEIKELEIDLAFQGSGIKSEFADCFFLLYGSASAAGMTYQDICKAIQEKFDVNKARKWGNPDKNGVVKHINEEVLINAQIGKKFSFEDLIAHGIQNGANIVDGMPWSWKINGHPVTHENDNCYLLSTLDGVIPFFRGESFILHESGIKILLKSDDVSGPNSCIL